MTELGYAPSAALSPVRRQRALSRAAGAVGLVAVAHLLLSRLTNGNQQALGFNLLSWRQWGLLLLLTAASAAALMGWLGPASTAPLLGVAIPWFCTDAELLLEVHALRGQGVTVTLSSELWLNALEAGVVVALAALALAAVPALRRVWRDVVSLLALAAASAFVVWQYSERTLGGWHQRTRLDVIGYDVLTAVAVLLPLVWGLSLDQPWRRCLVLGWVGSQGLYWAGWLEPRLPQTQFPWIFLIPPLLVLAVFGALRDEPSDPPPMPAARVG